MRLPAALVVLALLAQDPAAELRMALEEAPGPGVYATVLRLAEETRADATTTERRERVRALYGAGIDLLDAAEEASIASGRELASSVFKQRAFLGLLHARESCQLGDWDAAIDRLDRAESDLGDSYPKQHAQILNLRTQSYVKLGIIDQAAEAFERERAFVRPGERDDLGLDAYVKMAIGRSNLRLAQERYDDLVTEVEEMLALPELAAKDRNTLLLNQALGLSDVERTRPTRLPVAESLLREVAGHPATRPGDRVMARLRLAQHVLRLDRFEEARELVNAILENEPDGALGAETLVWARALAARLARRTGTPTRELHAELREAHDALVHKWQAYRRRSGGYGYLHYESHRLGTGELLALAMLEEPGEAGVRRAFEILCELQSLGTLSRDLGAPRRVALEDVRELLLGPAPGHGLLVYFPGTEESTVFALDRETITAHVLRPRDFLIRSQRDLVIETTSPPTGDDSEGWREPARRAARDLLDGGLEARLSSWDTVGVVALDWLGHVPFESLVLTDGSELGLTHAVYYIPSVPVGVALARREEAEPLGTPRGLLVAAPSLSDERRSEHGLADFPRESDWPGRLCSYAPGSLDSLVDADATSDAFRSLLRRDDHRFLELFVHGVRDPRRERSSGVLLADRALFAEDFEALAFPPTVILASCQTGRGPRRVGDPLVGDLAGALLRAGAHTVALPIADIPIEPTARLSGLLHHELRAGCSIAEALRRARGELAGDPATSHPFHRSLLHVHGLGHRPVFTDEEAKSVTPRGRDWLDYALVLGAVALGAVGATSLVRSRRLRHG